MIIKDIYKAFNHIYYEDSKHIYIDTQTNKRLTSVTTLLKRYEKPFASDFMSKRMVDNPNKPEYAGMTQEDILLLWSKMAILGNTAGTILHNYLEQKWYNKEFPIAYHNYEIFNTLDEDESNEFIHKCETMIKQAHSFIKDHPHIIPIRPELIVGNDKIAGQIDFFGYDTEKEEYILLDYKTDKKIDYENTYQNFLKPLTKLQACNFNKYCLQVNIYRKLLQPVADVSSMYIIWFNKDNDSYVKLKVEKDDKNINLII